MIAHVNWQCDDVVSSLTETREYYEAWDAYFGSKRLSTVWRRSFDCVWLTFKSRLASASACFVPKSCFLSSNVAWAGIFLLASINSSSSCAFATSYFSHSFCACWLLLYTQLCRSFSLRESPAYSILYPPTIFSAPFSPGPQWLWIWGGRTIGFWRSGRPDYFLPL